MEDAERARLLSERRDEVLWLRNIEWEIEPEGVAEVDWAQENQSVLADPEMWVGQTATRALRTGMVLRHGMVRPSQVFQAGSMVRIVAQGPGFQVTSGGQALSAGVVGEMARVRVDNGRVVSGLVLDMRTVQVNL